MLLFKSSCACSADLASELTMFLSDSARLSVYYSALRQDAEWSDARVAYWFVANVAFGRYSGQFDTLPADPTDWPDWDKKRKWPIVSFLELSCPFDGPRCPEGWHHGLPWFSRFSRSRFTFGSNPAKRHCP